MASGACCPSPCRWPGAGAGLRHGLRQGVQEGAGSDCHLGSRQKERNPGYHLRVHHLLLAQLGLWPDCRRPAGQGLCERIGIDGKFTYKPTGKDPIKLPMWRCPPTLRPSRLCWTPGGQGQRRDRLHEGDRRGGSPGGPRRRGFQPVCPHHRRGDEALEDCIPLAPLHNPANITGIKACEKVMPGVPMVAVFDTAFHQTMPKHAYLYAVPYELYEKYGVRRYGFHGTSHRYVSQRVCEFLGVEPEGKKIITCHIGNGGSITAIKDGKCVDTSMGLTPLEGLMMGTRSGDIDAGAVSFIMEKEGLDANGISNLLNKKSGVLGIFGESSDMRDLENAVAAGNPKAVLAEEMYFYRIKKYIGAYAAALGGVDIVVFTGGVGENQASAAGVHVKAWNSWA